MRNFRHWTPRYVWDRINVAWYESRHPDNPWLTRTACDFLSSWLKPTDQVVEFGSGRSTAWFASRCRKVISVEHDEGWFDKVSQDLVRLGLQGNVTYRMIDQGHDENNINQYLAPLLGLEDNQADLVLVDGLHRDHCALASLPKVRPGGLVVVDNVNWFLWREPASRSPASRTKAKGDSSALWSRFREDVSDWRVFWTTNGVSDTAIWQRPAPV
jgi:hypothetical protein